MNRYTDAVLGERGYERAVKCGAIDPEQWVEVLDEVTDIDWNALDGLFTDSEFTHAPVATTCTDFTPEAMMAALRAREERLSKPEPPPVELHHPECPYYLSGGRVEVCCYSPGWRDR